MKAAESNWYKTIWTLDITNQSWVEDTKRQVDFLINKLGMKGNERILDLACGFGRHSIELAERGFSVVGVDITKDYIDFATKTAQMKNLDATFILSDIRELSFDNEFDIVLNMGDGAVGYLENDGENLKIFDVIAKALKPGGRHFMDIINADYAAHHFPCRLWDAGEKCLTLSQFEWDNKSRIMLYGQIDYMYDSPLVKPVIEKGNPTRLYALHEIKEIMSERGLTVIQAFSDFSGEKVSADNIQMLVYSEKG